MLRSSEAKQDQRLIYLASKKELEETPRDEELVGMKRIVIAMKARGEFHYQIQNTYANEHRKSQRRVLPKTASKPGEI